MSIVELSGVSKQYTDITALQSVNLTVRAGEVLGLAGANGSGKSTTINIILGHVRPTAGSVHVFGQDVTEDAAMIRDHVGAVPDQYALYDRLTGREHVEFVARLRSVDVDPVDVLDRVGLADAVDQPAGTYSNGMEQRLVMALALIGNPDLLVFDEPFTGIDTGGIAAIRDLVCGAVDEETAVVLSSHRLEDLSAMCDRIATLEGGTVATVESVGNTRDNPVVLNVATETVPDAAFNAIQECNGVLTVSVERDTLQVVCERSARLEVLTTLDDHGISVVEFDTTTAGSSRDAGAIHERDGQ